MYENAGVEPQYKKRIECKDGYTVGHPCQKGIACINCNKSVFEDIMPPFTAEKQLKLIKWLGELDLLEIMRTIRDTKEWIINSEYGMSGNVYKHASRAKTFEEALAKLINSLWQDLTDTEKEQIRNILKG